MVEGLESSPYSSELSEFEADETMDDEDFYESEESFDGPLKEEYRGRSWSASAGQDNAAAAAAAVWHQQQQQPAQRSTVGQEAAAAATRVYDQQQHIDRLFHGLGQQQQRVSAYVSPVTKEVARSPAPAPAPAHTAAQSPVALAEFLADGVWSLLLTPYAPASKDVAVTRYEGARSAKVGAYEEDCWSRLATECPLSPLSLRYMLTFLFPPATLTGTSPHPTTRPLSSRSTTSRNPSRLRSQSADSTTRTISLRRPRARSPSSPSRRSRRRSSRLPASSSRSGTLLVLRSTRVEGKRVDSSVRVSAHSVLATA